MLNSLEDSLKVSIPLTKNDRNRARSCSEDQGNLRLSERIYLNRLSVLATQRYFQMINIESDLYSSYSWNIANQLIGDISDLFIPECNGRVECRPVLPGSQSCWIPQELWTDRVGYIIVEIDDKNSEATLLGFFRTVSREMMPLSNLQSLDSLIDIIELD